MIFYNTKEMKSSFVLFELLLGVVLFSMIAFITGAITKEVIKKNSTKHLETFVHLQLESTRLFCIKNGVLDLEFKDESLYFGENLLLQDLIFFSLSSTSTIHTIDICMKDTNICQQWKIKV